MLAWVCDLIVATDDAYFSDPLTHGYRCWCLSLRVESPHRQEFLFTGNKMGAERAYQMGMVNQVSTRDTLMADVEALAMKIAAMPQRLALTKQAINNVEELQGKRSAMGGLRLASFTHVHNDLTTGNKLGGMDAKSMAKANKETADLWT